MNCRYARQLISPYLDHQLTGCEMLEVQEHFSHCQSCAEEMNSIIQVKRLLRGLHAPRPERDLSGAIGLRLTEAETKANGWRVLSLPPTLSLPSSFGVPAAHPPRGRRLATALILSCLTILAVAAPSRDGAHTTSGLLSSPFSMSASTAPSLELLPVPETAETAMLNQTPTQITSAGEMDWTVISSNTTLPHSDFLSLVRVKPSQGRFSVFPRPIPAKSALPVRFEAAYPTGYSR